MSGLNRQGKIRGRDTWLDCGPVSFEDCAIMTTRHAQLGAEVTHVVVRDMEDPDVTHELKVERFIAHKVTGLRGGM